ncbi:MAG: fluoride efflux transporter CrcB [Deltaproteobacteria bacterium]|nr:fluoride efflux transporter CrcB [Deltaproteobacteria bacterium]
MTQFLLVCMGGALGSGLRFLVSKAIQSLLGLSFPYGTLTVNVLGSFFMSLIISYLLSVSTFSDSLRIFLTVGVLGGFTTYSSFNQEIFYYFQREEWKLFFLYSLSTFFLCLLAAALAAFLIKSFITAQ